MLVDIAYLKQHGIRSTEWVFVNAWAIYDRRSEYPLGDYTENPNNVFNLIVRQAAIQENIDIVFAAGNCGLFCPRMNCGRDDRGPGRSIFGANSHSNVLTTGAVRTDDIWLGYSSQGPGQARLNQNKPDLCSPSQFRENDDAHLVNTGTSASCAVAAAVIAALRSRPGWNSGRISPDVLRDYLIRTARKTHYPMWNGKLGNGVLDVDAVFSRLRRDYP
jgi:subtilisin family serine protease